MVPFQILRGPSDEFHVCGQEGETNTFFPSKFKQLAQGRCGASIDHMWVERRRRTAQERVSLSLALLGFGKIPSYAA